MMALSFAAAVVLTAIFVWWEARFADPMVPLALFSSRAFSGANLLTFSLYFSLSAMLFYLPMTIIGGWGMTEADMAAVPGSALALSPISEGRKKL